MSDFLKLVSASSNSTIHESVIAQASQCLEKFTDAFNACDADAMDLQLAFPHLMLSGAHRLEWNGPGQLPENFFSSLKAQQWSKTRYLSKTAVLASDVKVHFVVRYTRETAAGEILSVHENLWVVVLDEGQWKIAVRSY